MTWLGIDIGTSAVKAILVDDRDAIVAQSSAPLTIERSQPLWSEQHPDAWWQGVQAAIIGLPAALRRGVRGIGLSGQMHGAVLLGADDRPLRPAILWNDGRSSAECALLPQSGALTGNLAMPGFTAPKLLWVKAHETALFDRIAKILLPKDYVRLCLTGDHASDMSDSAGTLWLDTAARKWSPAMLDACGLKLHQMPRLFEGSEVTGTVRPDVAARLGLPAVPVAAGGGDNAAGAVGVGVTEPGQGFLSLGTSGVIFAVSAGHAPNPGKATHAFCHALPDRWHQMGVILSAASAVDWAARVAGFASVAPAAAAAEALGKHASVPLFLPYLSGERTPHNDAHATGVFFGLTHDHGPAHLVRAALEGVAFALADGADVLRDAGTRIDALTVIGGGARSAFWGRILASALGCQLDYRVGADVGPALGAARLTRMAVTGAPVADVCTAPDLIETIVPDPATVAALAPRQAAFRAIYLDLHPHFAKWTPGR